MSAVSKYGLKKTFNTSGMDYRKNKISEKLDLLTTEEAVDLMLTNGNLIKRPFLVNHSDVYVGNDSKRIPLNIKEKV